MQIECKIKRKDGSIVEVPNGPEQPTTRYHFKPIDPTRADSPHVAEVSNAHAAALFRADARVYVPFGEATLDAGSGVVARPVAPVPAPPLPVEPDPPAAPPAPEAGDADTNGDGALSVRELKKGIADGTLDAEKIRELMAAEEASPEPRQSFIDVCVKSLK